MKNKVPPARAANDKYGLSKIKIGSFKDFKPSLYDTIRLSAHYYGKKLECKFPTRKMVDDEGKKVVRVYREAL